MDVRSAIAAQHKKIKMMTPRQKREYIWDYYKHWIILGVLVAVILVNVIYTAAFTKEKVLYVTLVNATGYESDVFDQFLAAAGFDSEDYAVDINAAFKMDPTNPGTEDAQTLQVLYALFGTGDLDIFGADEVVFDFFAESGGFEDLRDYLSPEFLAENEDRLYKVTLSSGEEIIAGIYPEEGSPFMKAGYYSVPVPLGVVTDAINIATAVACLHWIISAP